MINSHALYRLSYRGICVPHLRGNPGSFLLSRAVTSQVSSALQSLTSVFGMGTGVTSVLSPPSILNTILVIYLHALSKLIPSFSWSSPRPISTGQLNTLLHLHLRPINLVVFKGSYYLSMGYLISRGASRLDAFSVYPFRT